MLVMDIIKDIYTFDAGRWTKNGYSEEYHEKMRKEQPGWNPLDEQGIIDKYNDSESRFIYYPWGVWVTSYARNNLFRGIAEFGIDYAYADTDSCKIMNSDRHAGWIEQYNQEVMAKIEAACVARGINPEKARPKNKDDVVCPLGVWDHDGHYERFKTIGAKRYMYEAWEWNKKTNQNELNLHTTFAGLSKIKLPEYLKSLGGDPFTHFGSDLTVPSDMTGKLTHCYCDEHMELDVEDCYGNIAHVTTDGGVHLEPQDYDCSIKATFKELIAEIQGEDTWEVHF